MSIYANHLKQNRNEVIHGEIREVSLVIAGANPGASIDTILMHGDGTTDELNVDEGILYTANLLILDFSTLILINQLRKKSGKRRSRKKKKRLRTF